MCTCKLKINENATLVFSMSFQHGLVIQNSVFIRQSYFWYSIKRLFSVLIHCQYALFKSSCSKTSYLTPFNVPHDWFVFFDCALLADWMDNIFSSSECWYLFSYQNIRRLNLLKMQTILELVEAVSWKFAIQPVFEYILHVVCNKHEHSF